MLRTETWTSDVSLISHRSSKLHRFLTDCGNHTTVMGIFVIRLHISEPGVMTVVILTTVQGEHKVFP
jgi:hypothetical protein